MHRLVGKIVLVALLICSQWAVVGCSAARFEVRPALVPDVVYSDEDFTAADKTLILRAFFFRVLFDEQGEIEWIKL